MKNDEVIKHVLNLYKEHTLLTTNEIQELIPEDIAMIQIHKAIKVLKDGKQLKEQLSMNIKYYSVIIDGSDVETKVNIDKGGRDVTKYKFNGVEYGKSRLAHAIISYYVKKNEPIYKELCDVFPVKLIPPYGLFVPLAEALEVSKDRARFFVKDREVLELSDGPVCVSNQFTKERIDKLINITQERLEYEILEI